MEQALTICEICGKTFTTSSDIDVCDACLKSVKSEPVIKKPSSTLVNAVKRVMKGQTSKALKVRACGCEIEKVLAGADKMGERMENIEINGINIIAHQLSDKIQVTYERDNQVISGYYA